MYRVTRLNPITWAKAFTLAWLLIAVVVGLLFALPALLVTGLGAAAAEDARPLLVALPVALVVGAIGLAMAAVVVFLISLIQGLAFNWALGRMGGLELDLALGPNYQPAPAPAAQVPPPPDGPAALAAPPAAVLAEAEAGPGPEAGAAAELAPDDGPLEDTGPSNEAAPSGPA